MESKNELVGILVDVKTQHVTVARLDRERELDELYRVLNCDTIDITVRSIDGHRFDIVCDDEGLLKESPIVSAVNMGGQPALVGNLFVCSHTPDGELKSLTEQETLQVWFRCAQTVSGLRVLVIDG